MHNVDDWWLESYSEMDLNTRGDINADGHTDRQKTEQLYCISELQIRRDIEDNSRIIFLISQKKHML